MRNKIANKALVLFSGGQDSTTCLYWARENFDEVIALNISYGQRHRIEGACARKICSLSKIEYLDIETDLLKLITNSALLQDNVSVNTKHKSDSSLPATFVPGRNILFLTIAKIIAYNYDIKHVVTGVCQTDYSGYPDCRRDTINALETTLTYGLAHSTHIHTPLMYLTKEQTVQMALLFSGCMEALSFSHTCYEGAHIPCGDCPACKLRAIGFEEAGIQDPLISRLKREEKI